MQAKIKELLKKRNAIMLAHNYQPPEIQDLADLCGDSLELSMKAADTDADVILFCGVMFMAETASILSSEKTVLPPRHDAGCLMSDMITAEGLDMKREELGDIPIVTYVNSTADVKAISTICCTSANAVKVVNSLDADEVFMAPDRNLARYVASKTTKKIRYWDGYCPSHEHLKVEDVAKAREAHPTAEFICHPECRMDIIEMADHVTSTSGMLRRAQESDNDTFIIGTEVGLLYPLRQQNPGKTFHSASEKMLCRNMKRITLEDIVRSLENMEGEIKVAEDIRVPALDAVQKMLDLSR